MNRRSLPRVATLLLGMVLLTGCVGTTLPLPFRTGTGDDSYQVTVRLADLGNLVPNGDVKVGNITVGTITDVTFRDWTIDLTVSLENSASVPANAEARIGQKSLLGAKYLELAPPTDARPVGTLRDGDVIPLERTGRYPETEALLAALSLFLNQGGLAQLKTITSELNAALSGREADIRSLLHNVGDLASALNERKGDIVRAIDNMDRLTGSLAEQNRTIDTALREIPPGLAALERQRGTLVKTLDAVSRFGDVASEVIAASKADLHANLRALQPILGKLADSGKNLTESMGFLPTFPFASNTAFPTVINGDYGNLYVTVDLDAKTLSNNLLRGLTIGGVPLLGGSSLAAGLVQSNPLTAGIAEEIPLPLGQDQPHPDATPPPGGPADTVGGLLDWVLGTSSPGAN